MSAFKAPRPDIVQQKSKNSTQVEFVGRCVPFEDISTQQIRQQQQQQQIGEQN